MLGGGQELERRDQTAIRAAQPHERLDARDLARASVGLRLKVNVDAVVLQSSGELGGEAQGQLIMKLFPNGANVMNLQGQSGASPAIDRNKGVHNVLDKAADKYKIVFEQTAGFDRSKGLSVTEAALAGMATPPQVIVAANDDMALGALGAIKARNLKDIVIIGFDALPETLGKIRDGEITATIEQFPGKQSATGVDILTSFLKDGTKPAQQITLLTPVAITKKNLNTAERLSEVK